MDRQRRSPDTERNFAVTKENQVEPAANDARDQNRQQNDLHQDVLETKFLAKPECQQQRQQSRDDGARYSETHTLAYRPEHFLRAEDLLVPAQRSAAKREADRLRVIERQHQQQNDRRIEERVE